jgi:NAD(P)-dependent dehydrogenase (short-subunit alcohol dehydrogenase family)
MDANMRLLQGKVALITGGARGQGRAHALACARAGGDVVLVDIADQIDGVPYKMARVEDLNETVRQVEQLDRRALAFTGDVRSQEVLDKAVSSAIAEFGKIDILIANAGIWTTAPFWELTDQAWDNMIGTNHEPRRYALMAEKVRPTWSHGSARDPTWRQYRRHAEAVLSLGFAVAVHRYVHGDKYCLIACI